MQSVGRGDSPAHTQVLASEVKQVHTGDGLDGRLLRIVLDEPVAFMSVRRGALLELAILDGTESFEYAGGGRKGKGIGETLEWSDLDFEWGLCFGSGR